jgi:hypothetical protein
MGNSCTCLKSDDNNGELDMLFLKGDMQTEKVVVIQSAWRGKQARKEVS